MSYPRTKLVLASRIGDLPGPIDGPTVGPNHSVLRQQAALAVGAAGLLGFGLDAGVRSSYRAVQASGGRGAILDDA